MKSVLKFISIPVFLISFAFGLFFIYIWGEDLHPVFKYPTPENVASVLYKDNADTCYKYNQVLTECTHDAEEIKVQE
jgi:hypothetical protein